MLLRELAVKSKSTFFSPPPDKSKLGEFELRELIRNLWLNNMQTFQLNGGCRRRLQTYIMWERSFGAPSLLLYFFSFFNKHNHLHPGWSIAGCLLSIAARTFAAQFQCKSMLINARPCSFRLMGVLIAHFLTHCTLKDVVPLQNISSKLSSSKVHWVYLLCQYLQWLLSTFFS
jgi:hypothetical protein